MEINNTLLEKIKKGQISLEELIEIFAKNKYSLNLMLTDFKKKSKGILYSERPTIKLKKYQDFIDDVLYNDNNLMGLLTRAEDWLVETGLVAFKLSMPDTSTGKKITIQIVTASWIKWNEVNKELDSVRITYKYFSGTYTYIIYEIFTLNKPIEYQVIRESKESGTQAISLQQYAKETGKVIPNYHYTIIKKIPIVIMTNHETDNCDPSPDVKLNNTGVATDLFNLDIVRASILFHALTGHGRILGGGLQNADYINKLNTKIHAGKGVEFISDVSGFNMESLVVKPNSFLTGDYGKEEIKISKRLYEMSGYTHDIANESGAQKNDLEHKYNRRTMIGNFKNKISIRNRKLGELIRLIILMAKGEDIKLSDIQVKLIEQPLTSLAELGDFLVKTNIQVKLGDHWALGMLGFNEDEADNQIKAFDKSEEKRLAIEMKLNASNNAGLNQQKIKEK